MNRSSLPLTQLAAALALALLSSCFSVPLDTPKDPSYAFDETSSSVAAGNVKAWLDDRDDVNGFYPLTQGFDAFGARLRMIDGAEISIDAQYFLMKPDNAGNVFASKLLEAAERGVRVRLLLDDIFTTVEDVDLAVFDEHPNFEVRIFNPIARKGFRSFNYLGNFSLLNRRMHNKSFVVDNEVAVVGGRNIASEYYQLETTGEFIDFDMLCAGPIVREVSTQFDTYWNHRLAVPLEVLFKGRSDEKLERARLAMDDAMRQSGETIYGEAIHSELMQQFLADTLPPFVADARLMTDEPEKLLTKVSDDQKVVVRELAEVMLEADEEIVIFTPYFIPRKGGIEFIKELEGKGVDVVVVTNSLATNNHTPVHSAYSGYRKDLLRAGVELWEARADAAKIVTEDGETQMERLTLHTKGMLIDRRHLFVGSLNLDPRSIDINTEMGLLIDSRELGALVAESVIEKVPAMAYRLKLDEDGKITWHANIDGREVVETKDPQTSWWRRCKAWWLKILPENQL